VTGSLSFILLAGRAHQGLLQLRLSRSTPHEPAKPQHALMMFLQHFATDPVPLNASGCVGAKFYWNDNALIENLLRKQM
jgi:hypothetical protein